MALTTQGVWSAVATSLVQRNCSVMTAVFVNARTTPMVSNATRVWMNIMVYQTPHAKVRIRDL